jgi:hypothetical protein
MTDPKQKDTIKEIIDHKYGTCEVLWVGDKIYNRKIDSGQDNKDDSEAKFEDKPTVGQGDTNHCPYDGTSKS